ncbi:MAG: L-seryl-tRNA(Sec) selenium transferase [Myxococcales bacterium]|nr:L-seryl-tRNA(Sec) selenium transferase [Myxococcales bacterium]
MTDGPAIETLLRQLPGVDQLLGRPSLEQARTKAGHRTFVDAARHVLDQVRSALRNGERHLFHDGRLDGDELERWIAAECERLSRPSLRRVINATGIIAHTNLGRAPLAAPALAALTEIASGYSTLEFDPQTGGRAERLDHVGPLLCRLTGAEAALVVNNNAAAVLLALSAIASSREVIVSRGELVEIGGSFRMPDVMRMAGCRLREVGTTNKTKIGDYAAAIGDETSMLLKVHRSNFRIVGFTEEVDPAALAELGRERALPVVEDLGSGSLLRHDTIGIRERTVQDAVRDRLDLICFSGDKMLGGPQAGIVVGGAAWVERLRRHPLFRALRPGKLTLSALAHTLQLYWRGEELEVPVIAMLRRPLAELRSGAKRLSEALAALAELGYRIAERDGHSEFGAGSLPATPLPTRLVTVEHDAIAASELEESLRSNDPTILVCVRDGRVVLDVRTLRSGDLPAIAGALRRIAAPNSGESGR